MDAAFAQHLESMEGVEEFEYVRGDSSAQLVIRNCGRNYRFSVREERSHLSTVTAEHIVANTETDHPLLVLAPYVGQGISARFRAKGVNYLDRAGNCHIASGGLYVHVEGRRAQQSQAERGLRSAGYHALFAFLAEPALVDAPMRDVARRAGVSTRPVFDLKHRLLDDEYIVKTRSAVRWVPRRLHDALNLWLRGYEATVRPALVHGYYRTRDDPMALERRIVASFEGLEPPGFRWGGSTAGYRLTGHYRGPHTTFHMAVVPANLRSMLGVLAAPDGELLVLTARGQINWQTGTDTVHPLLVYSEMMMEGTERAREAAQGVLEEHVLVHWKDHE